LIDRPADELLVCNQPVEVARVDSEVNRVEAALDPVGTR
jgi:hypothetical protein